MWWDDRSLADGLSAAWGAARPPSTASLGVVLCGLVPTYPSPSSALCSPYHADTRRLTVPDSA